MFGSPGRLGDALLLGQRPVVHVAPRPGLADLPGRDHRMAVRAIVLPRVLVRRSVAAPDVSAREADAKVNPAAPSLETILASARRSMHRARHRLGDVFTRA
jgi:hypothetical protein